VETLQQAGNALSDANSYLAASAMDSELNAEMEQALNRWQNELSDHETQVGNLRSQQGTISDELRGLTLRRDELSQAVQQQGTVESVCHAKIQDLEQEVAVLQAELQTQEDKLFEQCRTSFVMAPLKPLSPEQMCWSIFKVTGVYDRYAAIESAALAKELAEQEGSETVTPSDESTAAMVEQRTFNKLKGHVATFVKLYGHAAGQPQSDFYASADQALFMANGSSLISWLAPSGDNPVQRMLKAEDPQQATEELYLGILTRMPTETEVAEVAEILKSADDKSSACQAIAWGLMNSAEFRFNH